MKVQPSRQRTLRDIESLNDPFDVGNSLGTAILLIRGEYSEAAKEARCLVIFDPNSPNFTKILADATDADLADAADFALRDLLTEYPGLRALCETLPVGMTEEWEEDEE